MRSHGCVRVSLPLSPCDRVGHTATLPGFESMKMGVCLLFGRTKRPDLHRISPPAFFAAFRWQLGARCSLDRCDNSRAAGVRLGRSFRPIRFGLPKLISSEKERTTITAAPRLTRRCFARVRQPDIGRDAPLVKGRLSGIPLRSASNASTVGAPRPVA
jgi:hypothetical protein